MIPAGRPILLCDNIEALLAEDGILDDARTVTLECGSDFKSFWTFPLYENGRSRVRNSESEEGVGDPALLEPIEERFGKPPYGPVPGPADFL